LVVGPRQVSLDIQSLRGPTAQYLDLLNAILETPDSGPSVVNVDRLMDSLDETPMSTMWSLPPAQQEKVLRGLERLLRSGRRNTPSREGVMPAA